MDTRRGIRFFEKHTKAKEVSTLKKKGRAKDLIERRDNLLLYRYYYYARIKRMRYEHILLNLSNEFFISCRTVAQIMIKNSDQASEIFSQKQSIEQLRKMYAHFTW